MYCMAMNGVDELGMGTHKTSHFFSGKNYHLIAFLKNANFVPLYVAGSFFPIKSWYLNENSKKKPADKSLKEILSIDTLVALLVLMRHSL
jgi:hypothetical protein